MVLIRSFKLVIKIFFHLIKYKQNQKIMRNQSESDEQFSNFSGLLEQSLPNIGYLTLQENSNESEMSGIIIDFNNRASQQEFSRNMGNSESEKITKKQFEDLIGQSLFQEKKGNQKNNNLHKLLIRIFLKYYKSFAEKRGLGRAYFEFMKQIKEIKNQNLTRLELKELFGEGNDQPKDSFRRFNRCLLHEILSDSTIKKQQVLYRRTIDKKNWLKIMKGLKVYKLRAGIPPIIDRMQSR